MPGALWLARISSLGQKPECGASSNQLRPSHRSISGKPPGEFAVIGDHAREKGYLELDDVRSLGEWDFGSVRTEIRGEGAVQSYLEEGVVHKTVAVYQSMMQERSPV